MRIKALAIASHGSPQEQDLQASLLCLLLGRIIRLQQVLRAQRNQAKAFDAGRRERVAASAGTGIAPAACESMLRASSCAPGARRAPCCHPRSPP
jgi:hypothetical protein